MPAADKQAQRDSWNDPARVASFAGRDADRRLAALLHDRDPSAGPVLDLGCAGGRNLRLLRARGFTCVGVDTSRPMLARARREGVPPGGRRPVPVVRARMDALPLRARRFPVVVALGVYHCAESAAELDRALAESVRVLAPGGVVLVSVFAPGTSFPGRTPRPVPGEPPVHVDEDGGRLCLVDAADLDRRAHALGLRPVEATGTVRRARDGFVRVVVNACYAGEA